MCENLRETALRLALDNLDDYAISSVLVVANAFEKYMSTGDIQDNDRHLSNIYKCKKHKS